MGLSEAEDDLRHPDLYRRTAIKLRLLTMQLNQPDVKVELLKLAALFEKLASHAEARIESVAQDSVAD